MALFFHFLLLGCLAVGGLSTVLPDMYRYLVDEQGLLTGRQFTELYALSQAAPGPGALWVMLLGLEASGWTGAIATTLGVLIPATVFSLIASVFHAQHPDAPIALAIRRGLAPVALGFMLASGWLLLQSVGHGIPGYGLALLTFAVASATRMNPLWLMAAGALAGIAGL